LLAGESVVGCLHALREAGIDGKRDAGDEPRLV
jgi:hypothetical protein